MNPHNTTVLSDQVSADVAQAVASALDLKAEYALFWPHQWRFVSNTGWDWSDLSSARIALYAFQHESGIDESTFNERQKVRIYRRYVTSSEEIS